MTWSLKKTFERAVQNEQRIDALEQANEDLERTLAQRDRNLIAHLNSLWQNITAAFKAADAASLQQALNAVSDLNSSVVTATNSLGEEIGGIERELPDDLQASQNGAVARAKTYSDGLIRALKEGDIDAINDELLSLRLSKADINAVTNSFSQITERLGDAEDDINSLAGSKLILDEIIA